MRRLRESSDIKVEPSEREPLSWGKSGVILLCATAVAGIVAVVSANAILVLITGKIDIDLDLEVLAITLAIPAITVLPSIVVFLLVNRFWTRAAAQITCLGGLWCGLSYCVVVEAHSPEVSGVGWFMAGITIASGAAAFGTLGWMTRAETDSTPQAGTVRDQP